jgi:hypothetical protein
MADEIVIKYSADVKNLEKSLHGIEDEMKDVQKASVSTGNTIQKEANESAKALNKVDKSTRGLKDSFQNLSNHLPFAGAIQQAQDLTQAFTGVTGSVGKTSSALKVLKTAFMSIGIGALVVAFGSLVAYFKSTEEGGDKLAKIMRVVGAVVDSVVKVFATFGGMLFDVGEKIYDYAKGSDTAKKATDDYKKSVTELTAEVADLEDAIEDATIAMEVQAKIIDSILADNIKKLKNRDLAYKDGQKIIEDSGKLLKDQAKAELAVNDQNILRLRKLFIQHELNVAQIDEEVRQQEAYFKLASQGGKEVSKAIKDELALKKEQQKLERVRLVEFDKIVTQVSDKTLQQADLETFLAGLRGKFGVDHKKELQEALSQRIDIYAKESNIEIRLDNLKATLAEKEKARREKANENLTEEQKIRLDEEKKLRENAIRERIQSELRFAELKKLGAMQDLNIQAKTEIESTGITKEESDKRHTIRVGEMKKFSKDILQPIIDDSKASEEAQTAKLLEEEAKRKAIRQQGLMDALNISSQLLHMLNSRSIAREAAEIETQRAANETRLANELDALERRNELGLMSQEDYNREKERIEQKAKKRESDLKRKQWELDQKAALSKIGIDMLVAIAKSFATYGFTPAGFLAAGAAAAEGAILIAGVQSAPVPQFGDGGKVLEGKSHREGGILIEAEGGERIFSKKKTKQYEPLFKSIQEGYFDKYANENFVKPALKKEFEKNKLKEDRDKVAHEYMKSMVMNGLLDTSHLERLTKKNKSVKIENTKELIEGISNIVGSKRGRGL